MRCCGPWPVSYTHLDVYKRQVHSHAVGGFCFCAGLADPFPLSLIHIWLDRVMANRKISLKELSAKVGVSNVNLSKIKTGKISAVLFSTLDAICKALECQPGDILEYQEEEDEEEEK